MTTQRRTPSTRRSPMLHSCTAEGCTTIVFGRGPCVEHDPRRVHLAEHLLAEAVATAQHEHAHAERAVSPTESARQE